MVWGVGTVEGARPRLRRELLRSIAALCLLLAGTCGPTAQTAPAPGVGPVPDAGPGPADGAGDASPQEALPDASAAVSDVSMCTVEIPGECADAGLDAAECMAFYRKRIRDTRDILGRTLDFCDQTGATSSERDAENEIARLGEEVTRLEAELARKETAHRQELLELREEYTTRISDSLARVDMLAAERDRLAAELAALRETPRDNQPIAPGSSDEAGEPRQADPQREEDSSDTVTSAPPDTGPDSDPDAPTAEQSGTPLAEIAELGALLMDETDVAESVLPIATICASPAPSRSEVEATLSAAPDLFDDLSPIQRARIVQGLASGMDAPGVSTQAWRSAVRDDHIAARRRAAAHLCRSLPFSCIGGADRARLCE